MTKFPYGLRAALLGCEKSTSKVQVGAALIYKNRLVISCNSDKSSPGAARWYKYYDQGQHAEYNLFSRSMLDELPIRGTVYIARMLANNTTGLARPCTACKKMLKDLGIKKVIYTAYNNTFEEERL